MRDYQIRKTKYILPRAVYNQVLWIVRDYHRWVEECEEIDNSKKHDVNASIRSNYPKNNIEQRYISKERYLERIRKVDAALRRVPREYRKGVWDSAVYRIPYPDDAHRATYAKYKSKFIYYVAKNLNLV